MYFLDIVLQQAETVKKLSLPRRSCAQDTHLILLQVCKGDGKGGGRPYTKVGLSHIESRLGKKVSPPLHQDQYQEETAATATDIPAPKAAISPAGLCTQAPFRSSPLPSSPLLFLMPLYVQHISIRCHSDAARVRN